MKISIIGGGAWGTTLAQVLADNNHESLIYEINDSYVTKINKDHVHPIFNNKLDGSLVRATNNLDEVIEFSEIFVTAVPTKAMRTVLRDISKNLNKKITIVNISKGIEPETSKLVSEIAQEELNDNLDAYVCLTGPSHAEEVILRQITLLVSASLNEEKALLIQKLFSNKNYLRVYTSSDVIGAEVGGAAKNAIAVISGAAYGLGLLENARAAIITRGMLEIVKVVEIMGGQKETAYGLTGIGDLIVTASSFQSRNFQGGKKIGEGISVEEIYKTSTQTIEGIRTIYALNNLSKQHNVELPMINAFYDVLEGKVTVKEGLELLLNRDLKKEDC